MIYFLAVLPVLGILGGLYGLHKYHLTSLSAAIAAAEAEYMAIPVRVRKELEEERDSAKTELQAVEQKYAAVKSQLEQKIEAEAHAIQAAAIKTATAVCSRCHAIVARFFYDP